MINSAMELDAEDERKKKRSVCVSGGEGFVASWLIMKLLQRGYSVNATLRDTNIDTRFLTNLPHAGENLRIFAADLGDPQSFKPAIEGCVGVFHVAHPMDLVGTESVEMITERSIRAIHGILQLCIDSGTVKRVVYTSSISAVFARDRGAAAELNEEAWSDVEFMKQLDFVGAGYYISKTVAEMAAIEYAEKRGLDLVTVIPSWINGPFICPHLPSSIHSSLGLIIGNENQMKYAKITPMVHTDDNAEAHIYLFEHPDAKGRYICSAVEVTVEEMVDHLRSRHPHLKLLDPEGLINPAANFGGLSSKKLLELGFKYRYGVAEMFDDAIQCCKQNGWL
ncbi:vestitone reductase-like [Andrographis paniculata]|uniref:vestitone reductase-like n=1 Tax=Andrographis paniculata TaxID=175694 RepID=UPI0021E897DB|nr:vestitone reductase-like [Andrographis paniculata]XP_051146255.1 vestitone reductase-like [Andrographis paniculata]